MIQHKKLKFPSIDAVANNSITSLIQILPFAAYICDEKGLVQAYNHPAVQLWGRAPKPGEEHGYSAFPTLDPAEDIAHHNNPISITVRGSDVSEGNDVIIVHQDGTHKRGIIYSRPLFDSKGSISGAINFVLDITGQVIKTESVHKKRDEYYQRMISEIQDYAILSLNKEGIIQNWNKGAERIKKYRAEEAIGKHFRMFYLPEDREQKLSEKLLQKAHEEGRAIYEGWRLRKDGTRFWGSIVITALHDEHNNVIGFSKVTRDLSEMKAAQDALAENYRILTKMNQELASFAYVSSHDLQEPLRKIQTFSTRILEMDEHKLSDKGRDYFQRIIKAVNRMRTLIDDLLSYSKLSTIKGVFTPTDLNDVLRQVKEDLIVRIEESHAVVYVEPLPVINAVSFQMRQLFLNLVSNALKFSRVDILPKIVIRSELVAGKEVPPTTSELAIPGKIYHKISVADNGIGFNPEYRERVFQVFQRLHGRNEYEGTGIGLAICRKIVENHQGFISAEGQEGKGATFYVYLPG